MNYSAIERINSKQFSIEREGSLLNADESTILARPVTAPVIEDEKFHCYKIGRAHV